MCASAYGKSFEVWAAAYPVVTSFYQNFAMCGRRCQKFQGAGSYSSSLHIISSKFHFVRAHMAKISRCSASSNLLGSQSAYPTPPNLPHPMLFRFTPNHMTITWFPNSRQALTSAPRIYKAPLLLYKTFFFLSSS